MNSPYRQDLSDKDDDNRFRFAIHQATRPSAIAMKILLLEGWFLQLSPPIPT